MSVLGLMSAAVAVQYHRPHRLLLDTKSSTELSNGSRSRTFNSEANFDTNMVIILAALLCALICALGLNSIIRCALRCGRRFSIGTPDETSARLHTTGLKKSALRQIPVIIYGEAGIHVIATDCAICLGEFADGEKVRVLPKCNHGFHVRCIDTWLVSHSSCPTCRQSLLDQPATSDAAEAVPAAFRNHVNVTGAQSHDVPMPADEVG